MTRPAVTSGLLLVIHMLKVYGQLVGDCQADGPIATTPPAAGGLRYKIMLYKDPNSRDS